MMGKKGALAAVLLAVLVALGVVVFAWYDDATDRPAASTNGDMVGMESGESFSEYQERSATSLAAAPAGEAVFALITFTRPLDSAGAEQITADLDRVNAMLIGMSAPYSLPEPVAGESRAEVFERQFGRIADSLAGVGEVPVPVRMTAVIAYDEGEALRGIAGAEEVAAVEVLPPDAAWGRFGVRPVQVPGFDPEQLLAE